MTLEALKDFDNFYYHGLGELRDEIQSDVHQVVVQPSKSLYYNRANDSAGMDKYENTPNTIAQTVLIPYSIVLALSTRNLLVGDGQNNTKDRRVAISQNYVKAVNDGNNLEVSVYYIPLIDTKNPDTASIKFLN